MAWINVRLYSTNERCCVSPQLFPFSYRHAFHLTVEIWLFFFCILFTLAIEKLGTQRTENFYFHKTNEMWNNEKKKKSWPLECFRGEKKQPTSIKNVEQKSEVTEHFVDFFFLKDYFRFRCYWVPYSCSVFIGKHFVNSNTSVTCLADFVLQGSWLIFRFEWEIKVVMIDMSIRTTDWIIY